jgi:hypothetical protein
VTRIRIGSLILRCEQPSHVASTVSKPWESIRSRCFAAARWNGKGVDAARPAVFIRSPTLLGFQLGGCTGAVVPTGSRARDSGRLLSCVPFGRTIGPPAVGHDIAGSRMTLGNSALRPDHVHLAHLHYDLRPWFTRLRRASRRSNGGSLVREARNDTKGPDVGYLPIVSKNRNTLVILALT